MPDTKASAFTVTTSLADADLVPLIQSGANKVITAANIGLYMATESGLTDHLNDAVDAHDATAISYAGNAGLSAATVEAALDELDDEKLSKVAGGAAVENIGAVEANVQTVAATGATETLDTAVYQVFDCTMDQNCAFTFSNPAPSGKCSSFVLILRGAFTPTLPASVDWSSGSAPTYTTPAMYTFTTVDAGTTWLGAQVGRAFA